MNHYKLMYSQQCCNNKLLQKELNKLRKKLQSLQKMSGLGTKCSDLLQKGNEQMNTRKRKCWSQVKCDRTKCQCLNECGTLLLKTLKKTVPHFKRAYMSLRLHDKNVNYQWKSTDVQNNQVEHSMTDTLNFKKTSDHLYASPKLVQSCDDGDLGDIDYSTIFAGKRKGAFPSIVSNYN